MKKILLATVFGVASVAALSANAYVFSKNATVKIVTPLTLSTTTDLNFATVEKPASGTQTVVVDTAGATTGSTATIVGGTPTAGVYAVTGDATNQISIAVAAGTAVAGLTLASFTMNYNNAV